MSLNINFAKFHFENSGSFLSLDPSVLLSGLGKAYSSIDSIIDGSIVIKLSKSYVEIPTESTELLAAILSSGTKPFDAIYYMLSQHNGESRIMTDAFDFQHDDFDCTMETMNNSIKVIVACILLILSRGSFPASNSQSEKTNLPKFILNIIPGLTTEKTLKDIAISFDPKHLNLMNFILNESNFTNWDPIVLKRMALGVAGHKPFKVAFMLGTKLNPGTTEKEKSLIKLLKEKSQHLHVGFYPSLHPMVQSFTRDFPNFYKNMMYLIYKFLNVSNELKLQTLKATNMFNKDSFVNETIINFNPTYESWDLNDIETKFGVLVKFGTAKNQDKKAEMIAIRESVSDNKEDMDDLTGVLVHSSSNIKPSVIISTDSSEKKESLPQVFKKRGQ